MIKKILLKLSDQTNLLIRSKIDKPLQAITSDISELTYQNGKAYFCVHKDVFGQIPQKPLFHQDQGSQYTSYPYVEEALKHGTLSYSTPGTPTENPGQESFFGRFKDEWADEIRELETFEQIKKPA